MSHVTTLFIPIDEARELLGAPLRRNTFLYEDGLESANLRIKASTPNSVEVYYVSGDSDLEDIVLHFRDSYGDKMQDTALLERLDKIIAHNPKSKFLKSVRSEVALGQKVSQGALDVIEEIESNIQNPNNELLERLRRISELLGEDSFIDSLTSQVLGGKQSLSPRQEAAVAGIESRLKGIESHTVRVDNLLKKYPMDKFLKSLKSFLMGGRGLSQKQVSALETIERRSAPLAQSPKAPPSRRTKDGKRVFLLRDITQNKMSAADRAFLEGKIKDILSKKAISTQDLKKIRNLCYRYEKRLKERYPADFKSYVRKIFS
jgi:hypothetical protein